MKIKWEYALPIREQPTDSDYEGPILVSSGKVYFATTRFEHSIEERGRNRAARGSIITVHVVDQQSGAAETLEFSVPERTIPSRWNFIEANARILLNCGPFISVAPATGIVQELPSAIVVGVKNGSRPTFLHHDGHLFFAAEQDPMLRSFDLNSNALRWEMRLYNTRPYRLTPPMVIGEDIVCYGRDALNFINPETGEITKSLRIKRIDKVFSPIPVGDDLLLGYSNWSVGGVLRYNQATDRVVWRYRKKFQGPASYCKIWSIGGIVVWVKGETEIIGIDENTGEQAWSFPAAPWLYSHIEVIEGNLVFGTAGRDGYLNSVNPATGEANWSVFLKNGCESVARFHDSLIAGDSDGIVHQFDLSSGTELDRVSVDGQIVGVGAVADRCAYTVVWCNEQKPPRLICVELE